MSSKTFSRQLLLGSALLAVGFLVLTPASSFAASGCYISSAQIITCTGIATTQQSVSAPNYTVTTQSPLNITVVTGNALVLSGGTGGISFTDGDTTGSYFKAGAGYSGISVANSGGAIGNLSVTLGKTSTAIGGKAGVYSHQNGTGSNTITANGTVTGTNGYGIYAMNGALATNLSVTTGANSSVTGSRVGIFSWNKGTGATTITTDQGSSVTGSYNGILAFTAGADATTVKAYGTVTGTNGNGITAINASSTATDLTITTGASSTVSGSGDGMYANNLGTGATTITADGTVTGTNGNGIHAYNRATATDLIVTTAANSTVTGFARGILARNYGTGAITINTYGNVNATAGAGAGIYAKNSTNATGISVTTAAGTTVSSGGYGIYVANSGKGATTITANSYVSAQSGGDPYADGIFVTNKALTTGLTVTTENVTGTGNGLLINNAGTGATNITTNGTVIGQNGAGINSYNTGSSGTSITANGTVSGSSAAGKTNAGIYANNGTGSTYLTITTDASSTVSGNKGIYAINSGTGNTTINVSGTVTGSYRGIFAINNGTGATTITAYGAVTGTSSAGIHATNQNSNSTGALNITTGANSTIYGGGVGIRARNYGTGYTSVTANGTVTGTSGFGIYAKNYNFNSTGALNITTGSTSNITGGVFGILARNYGTGAITITAYGKVTGTSSAGIYATNQNSNSTGALNITTGAYSNVSGTNGIETINQGKGQTTITAYGKVTGTSGFGIYATNQNSNSTGALNITTGASSTIYGGGFGIRARNFGVGATTITTYGTVTGTSGFGIYAKNYNYNSTGALNITTGASSTIAGGVFGILAKNYGTGATTITAYGKVTGTSGIGIYASNNNSNSTGALNITTGASSTVKGTYGIFAENLGGGTTSITAYGKVTGTSGDGIYARNDNSISTGALNITTGTSSTITGRTNGITAVNYGAGSTTITTDKGSFVTGSFDGILAFTLGADATTVKAYGTVTGTNGIGIAAINTSSAATDLTITTGASSSVSGFSDGIFANNLGTGGTTITANGAVTGGTNIKNYGIYAENGFKCGCGVITHGGTYINVTTGSASNISGAIGIAAKNYGTGYTKVTANGTVTGTSGSGIIAYNASTATDLTITTGVGRTVTGYSEGILTQNNGKGSTTIKAYGNVASTNGTGISATNASTATDLNITTGAGYTVSGVLNGILAINQGKGSTTIIANGTVTGTYYNGAGIYAYNTKRSVGALNVTTGVGYAVTGGYGIRAINFGTGATTITANGIVAGTNYDGIFTQTKYSLTSAVKINTGASSTVTGGANGIEARNYGSGSIIITANGNVTGNKSGIIVSNLGTGATTINAYGKVTGTNNFGIAAGNSSNSTGALNITTGASSSVSGFSDGIFANNLGTGGTTITANGAVTGGTNIKNYGIYAENGFKCGCGVITHGGTYINVTTGSASNISGAIGIAAKNYGTGYTKVTANGTVTGTNGSGIIAYNRALATNLSVTTGANSSVTGSYRGIFSYNRGTGATTITTDKGSSVTGSLGGIVAFTSGADATTVKAYGKVYGTYGRGITAISFSSAATDLNITTGASSAVSGFSDGIYANNLGTGATTINAYGKVTGGSGTKNYGIYATNGYKDNNTVVHGGKNLSVTTGSTSNVSGFTGIAAKNYGTGYTKVTANGTVTGTNGYGIFAYNDSTATTLSITTGAGYTVSGHRLGIFARNFGVGTTSITADGTVTGTSLSGIEAANYNSGGMGALNITTGASSTVMGSSFGIFARNFGIGTTSITANGTVTGTSFSGIEAANYNSGGMGALNITTGASSTVTGTYGIQAKNLGGGTTTITASGKVTGTSGFGIEANNNNSNSTGALNITTGAGSKVFGAASAISAGQNGTGAFNITTGGIVASGAAGSYNINGNAIHTSGGPVTVSNLVTGNIIGTLKLGTNTTGNTFNNAGAWITTGTSDFASSLCTCSVPGTVLGTVNNTGAIFAAVGTGSSSTTFNNIGTFTNSGLLSLSTQTAGNGATPSNALTINGNFVGGGVLKEDAFLGATGSKSDTLTINGNVSGTTKVAIVNTNAGKGVLVPTTGQGIVLATVNGTASASNFVLANGPISSGLYVYNIQEVNASSSQELFELFSQVGVNSSELAEMNSGAENTFYDSLETVFNHLSDQNSNQQTADLGNGTMVTAAADVPGSGAQHGLWGKVLGNASQWGQGGAQGYNLSNGGFMAGLDGKLGKSDNLTLGLDAGYIRSYQHFNSGDYGNFDGLAGGIYAKYANGNFRTDAQLGAEITNLGYVQASAPGTINYATVSTIGGSIESGYKVPLKGLFYAEPIVRLNVANSAITNGSIAGTAFNAGGTSVRGALGVNFKGQMVSSGQADVVYRPSLGFKVWQEFGQQSSATFNSSTVYDLAPTTFGEVSLGTDIVNLSTGWTGTIAGTGRIADQYLSIGGELSLRKDF